MEEIKKITNPTQREKSKAKRRAAIIEIARKSLLENGYDGTSMSLIAQRMGGSKGTLWSYFSTKEELFAAVVDSVASAFRSFMDNALDLNKEVSLALTDFCKEFIVRITSPEAIAIQRIVISQAEKIPDVAKIFYEHGPAHNHAAISGYLKKQVIAGNLPKHDAEQAAQMLLDLCTAGYHDMILYGLHDRDNTIAEREAIRVVKLFWRCWFDGKVSRLLSKDTRNTYTWKI